MASGKLYITAGLPRPKDSGQSPTGNGSAFITAGLSKVEEAGAPAAGQPMMLRATTIPGMRQWHPRFCA